MTTAKEYAERRRCVEIAARNIGAHRSLSDADRKAAYRVLNLVLSGGDGDARKYLGIKAPRGPRKNISPLLWIATHYWLLRHDGKKDAVALDAVAKRWGISASRVRALKKTYQYPAKNCIALVDIDNIAETIEASATEFCRR